MLCSWEQSADPAWLPILSNCDREDMLTLIRQAAAL